MKKIQAENQTKKSGHIFIVSAPSGAGKSTLCNILLCRFENMRYSISCTTRQPRSGEKDGMDYHFISKEMFLEGIQTEKWAEWAEVHDNFYGTSSEFLDRVMALGEDVLLDIDVQGAMQIIEKYPDSVTIFIMPPSPEILRERLESRGTDDREVIAKRLLNAWKEMAYKDKYAHVIVNDQLEQAVEELVSIVENYRNRSR